MPRCWVDHRRRFAAVIALPAIFFAAAPSAKNADAAFDRREALAISQAAVGRVLTNRTFTDSSGHRVALEDFRGNPLLVSLIFTSCYHTCPAITQSLKRAVDAADAALGRGAYTVLTIGFDSAADTPERMRLYAREQGIDSPSWLFLSAEAPAIAALAHDLGFIYHPSPRGFDHLAQVSVVDAAGRVYRQVYGQDFTVPAIVEPLRELALGVTYSRSGVGNLIERVRLFCTVYDPASGRYRFDNSIVVAALTGFLSLGAVAVFLVRQTRGPRGGARKGSLPPVH